MAAVTPPAGRVRQRKTTPPAEVWTEPTQVPSEPDWDDTLAGQIDANAQAERLEHFPKDRPLDEFIWTTAPTGHSARRRVILEKHPEIELLYGTDFTQAIQLLLTVVLQFVLAYAVARTHLNWPKFLLVTYIVSATLNHSLFAGLHEASHRTMVSSKLGTELLCIACSLPMGLPAAIPFKRYHLDHHIYLGVEKLDPDLPTYFEARFFRSTFTKFIWIILLPFTYTMRPLFVNPKPILPIEVVGWCANIAADYFVYRIAGSTGLMYFFLGSFFSMSFHPFAGHFLAEHFIFPDERDPYQETASYYGIWNALTYNVGYHNEHHDFPRIPGTKLPLLRKIAPEFYDMKTEKSWFLMAWKFILTPNITPFNRVLRTATNGGVPSSPKAQQCIYHKGKYPAPNGYWPRLQGGGS